MFRNRNSSRPGSSPGKEKSDLSPIVELQECVSRMNHIVRSVWKRYHGVKGEGGGSPLKIALSKSNDGEDNKLNGQKKIELSESDTIITSRFVRFDTKQEEEMIVLDPRMYELLKNFKATRNGTKKEGCTC